MAGQRETKAVQRFIEDAGAESKPKAELQTGGGEGTALGKIGHVLKMLNNMEGDHDLLKALHTVMYKGPGTKLTRKKDIRAFNGFPRGTDVGGVKAKIEANKKWTVAVLKDACQLFALEKGGDRDALITRLVGYLAKPHPIAKPAPVKKPAKKPKAAKASGGKKAKKEKKKGGPKKPLSSYMLFAKSVRPKIVAENPSLKITEVATQIGALWKGLSEAEKNKYKAQAERLKAAATGTVAV